MKFRAKPVVVEAHRFLGDRATFETIWHWMDGDDVNSPMLGYDGPNDNDPRSFGVQTPDGRVRVVPGDWVVEGPKGSFRRLSPADFPAAYEPFEDAEAVPAPTLPVPVP